MSSTRSRAVALAAAVTLLPALAVARIPARPDAGTLLFDSAGLLDPEDRAVVAELQERTLADEGVALVVVTVPSIDAHLERASVERLAQAWMRAWGLGLEPDDRSMLLLVAERDRTARIELGPAWGRRWDARASTIMNERIVPAFRDARPSRGVVNGVAALSEMAALDPVADAAGAPWLSLERVLLALFLGGLLGIIVRDGVVHHRYRKRWGAPPLRPGDGPGTDLGSGAHWSGGHGGGGGSSGGGGSGGGGGATGSW